MLPLSAIALGKIHGGPKQTQVHKGKKQREIIVVPPYNQEELAMD
jgi:hypothetical protein